MFTIIFDSAFLILLPFLLTFSLSTKRFALGAFIVFLMCCSVIGIMLALLNLILSRIVL